MDIKHAATNAIAFASLVALAQAVWSAPPEMSRELRQLVDAGIADGSMRPPVPESFQRKLKVFADKGEAQAQYYYGAALSWREDHPEHAAEAKRYLLKAIESGCTAAYAALAGVLNGQEKKEEAIRVTLRGAESGDTIAQVAIAGAYERGEPPLQKSLATAMAWELLALRQNHSRFFEPAIKEGLVERKAGMTQEQRSEALAKYKALSKKVPVAKYFFCGQSLSDASKYPSINPYR